jgi:hypothetical protein
MTSHNIFGTGCYRKQRSHSISFGNRMQCQQFQHMHTSVDHLITTKCRSHQWDVRQMDYFPGQYFLAHSTTLLYNFVNKKLSILIYRSISYVGIEIYILASTNTTHPTNIITMVSHLPLQWHGFGESAHPTPGSLFGRGWTRSQ